jgi:hypothetical protein
LKAYLRIIATTVIMSLCHTPCVAIAAPRPASWLVPLENATSAAERLVASRASAELGQFAAWKDATVGEPTKYFGLDGVLATYCFPVEKDKTDVGYVMVGASRFEMPVQEFSCSAAPHKRANLEACTKAAKEAAGEGKELGVLRYAYLAPGLYAVEFPVLDKGVSSGSVFVDVVPSQVVKDATPAPEQEPNVSRTAKAGPAWLAITNSKTASKDTARIQPGFKYVVNVPLTVRRTEPDAAAWADVLNYWGVRKPREIPEFIAQQLAGSSTANDSLEGFAGERGYGLKLYSRQRDMAPPDSRASFTDVRMEVDSGHPYVVNVVSKLTSGNPVSSVLAGAGYAVDEMGQWLIVHSGISPTEPIPPTGQSAPWCRQGVVFVNWDCAVDSLEVTTVQVTREAQKGAE